jgi:hypothetical protein
MWNASAIVVEISEVEGNLVIAEIMTAIGRIQIAGEVAIEGRTLYLRRVHVQGLYRGALGRTGLNAIGRKLLEEIDVDQIVIEGSTRTTGKNPARPPRPFRFPGH